MFEVTRVAIGERERPRWWEWKYGQRRMRHSPRVVEAAPDVLPLGIATDGNVVTEVLGECQVVDHSVQTILLDRINAFDRSVA